MSCLMRCLAFALLLLGAPLPAFAAGERVALVIGNSAYSQLEPLKNARNDADDMAAALRAVGYDVVTGSDLSVGGFKQATRDFLDKLRGAETALFYYAGHGIQIDNTNYMLPVDAELKSITDVLFDAVPVQEIVRLMEQEAKTTVVLLDSCRDNPLQGKGLASGTRGVSIFPGFAPEDGASGTYIAFAAQPGQVSYDGGARNGPFAAAILKHLPTRGVDIRLMMADVRQDVAESTGNRQVPWENSSLVGRFFLNPLPAEPQPQIEVASSPPAEDPIAAEREAWERIVTSTEADDFLDFLADYPAGLFASSARSQLKRMMPAAVVAEPAKPNLVVTEEVETDTAQPAAPDAEIAAIAPSQTPVSEETQVLRPAQRTAETVAPVVPAPLPAAATETATATAPVPAIEPPPPEQPAQVAAIEPEPIAIAPAAQPTPEETKRLALDMQTELIRLGCLSGKADGVWGRKSENAMEDYAARQEIETASLSPDPALLTRLRADTARVCPLVCAARETVKGEICVTKTCAAGRELTAGGECRKIVKTAARKPAPKKPAAKKPQRQEPRQNEPRQNEPRYLDEDEEAGPRPGRGLCFTYNGVNICN